MQRIAILGISGRMGTALLHELASSREAVLSGALASSRSEWLERSLKPAPTAPAVVVTADPSQALRGADVAIDVSTANAVIPHALACSAAGVPLFVATTGLSPDATEALRRAAAHVAIVVAPNTSLGVNLLAKLVALAAQALGETVDIDIAETHHKDKIDAPSGTALKLGRAIADARGVNLEQVRYDALSSAGKPRAPGGIGFAVTRAGDVVGEHTVKFTGQGEQLDLIHRATDRACFARGALRGARWLIGKPPGLYSMDDVLEL